MKTLDLDLPEEIKKLEIAVKTLVTSKFIGNYRSVFRGRGIEFESYREYTPDDDSNLIDWKASARTNKLLIKEFTEERNLDVIFLLDTSAKMLFGSTEKIKSRYSAELIAALSYAIINASDNVSLITFNSKTKKVVPLGNSRKHFYKVAKELLSVENYGNSFSLEEALRFLLVNAKAGSLVMLVSDFINPGDNWKNVLRVASKKFDIIGLMVRDPRDRELPPGYKITLESPDTGKKMIVDTSIIAGKYSSYVREDEAALRKEFLSSNSDFVLIQTDKPFIEPIINLFRSRQRKWR